MIMSGFDPIAWWFRHLMGLMNFGVGELV